MIAYKEKSLDQLVINEECEKALKRQLITAEEYGAIKAAHKSQLYSPNMFIRIGLFVLTVVIVFMSCGLLFLFAGNSLDNETAFFVITLFYGIFIYAALEWMIKRNRHYRSGVDDALLWLSLIFVISDISIYFDLTPLQISTFIFVLSLAAAIRFANSVMSAIMFGSFISIIFFAVTPLGTIAKTILPFLVMLISFGIYLVTLNVKHAPSLRHYKYCFKMLEVLALVTMYVSVNYLVVRELSVIMFDLNLPQDASIMGGWFFWTCTILLPILYIARGLQKKDHVILRTGILLVGAAVFTYRFYYSIAPVEQVMTAAGIAMVIIAYTTIRYLQKPRFGISDQPNQHGDSGPHLESLVIAETFKEVPATDDAFRFGGGSTGGGGATGQY